MYVYSILLFVSLFIFSALAYAINGRTTYQAKIYKPDGLPLEAVSVNFRFTVLDPSSSCVLFVEDYAAVNMIGSGGLISFSLGMGTRTYPASGPTTFAGVFDNSTSSFVCQSPGVFNPVPTDNRKVVMQFNEGTGWQTLPAMAINSVPYAMYAAKSQNSGALNGKADTAFVEVSTLAGLNCQTNEAIKFNGATFSCIPVGASGLSGVTTSGTVLVTGGTASAPVISITAATMSSDGYLTSLDYAEFKAKLSASSSQIVSTLGYAPVSGAAVNTQIQASQLAGDVSGTISSNSVQSVGGKTSAQVATSVDDTLAATSSSTADTIVKRNSSGNFTANDIYASSTKLNYVDIYKPSTSFSIRLQAPTSLAANYTLNLPTSSGTVGQVLSTDGSGNLSWISAATGSVTSVSATAPLVSTGGPTPTISITLATSSTNGYLSSTDWNTFNNKQQATAAAINTTLGYAPVSGAAVNTQVQASQLNGDVSGTVSANFVQTVGGKTSAQVATSVNDTAAATASATADTIVKRNSAGNFTANDVYANATKTSYVDIYKPGTGFNVRVQAPASLATNYVLNLPTTSGTAGQVLSTDGSGTLSWISSTTGSVTSVSATAPLISSGGSTPSISITQSTSSANGYLSSTDWNTFNNKQPALGYTPAHATSATQWTTNGAHISYSTGNVGIGISIPTQVLDVRKGVKSADNVLAFFGTTDANDMGLYIENLTNSAIHIGSRENNVANKDLILNRYGGYVGIGRTAPATALDVSGSIRSGASNNGSVITGNDGNAFLEMRENDNNGTPYMDFVNDAATDYDFRLILNGDDSFSMTGGFVGIGTLTPNAGLHLAAGTSSYAPLKLTSGTLLTSPQSGTMEFDGNNFYLTDSANIRRTIATGSAAGSIDNASNINSSGHITMTPVGSVIVSSTTASTNSSTGALVVNGGLGVAGNINAGGNIQGVSITATSGMVSPYIYGSTAASGSLVLDSTTNATKGNISLAPNGGRVAIGTTNPANAKLHIAGAANQIDLLIQPLPMAAFDTSTIRFADSDGGTGPMDIVYHDAGSPRLSVMGGRFGIGVSSPITDFEIAGSMSVKGGEIFMQRPVTAGGWARGLGYTPDGSVNTTAAGIAGIGLYGTSTTTNSIYLTHGASPWASTLGVHILPSGNVGVATTAPRQLIDVAPGTGNSVIRSTTSDAAAALQLYKKTGAAYHGHALTTQGSALFFNYDAVENSGSTLMTLSASGNLGIGTAPGEKLDVLGNLRVGSTDSNYIAFRGTTGDGAGNYNHTYIGERVHTATEGAELLLFKGNDSDNVSGPDRIRMAAGNIVFDTYASPDAPSGSFEFVASSPMITTKMIIKGDGKVGIGTTAPAEELSLLNNVDGDASINVTNSSSGAAARSGFTLTNSGSSYGVDSGGLLLAGKSHATMNDRLHLFANSGITSGINIAVSGPSAPVSISTGNLERMRVTQGGYVGIGTTAPGSKLEVAGGDINVTTGRVSFNAGTNSGTAGIASSDAGAVFGEHDVGTETSRLVIEIYDNNNDQIVLRTNAPSGGANVDMMKVQYNQVAIAPTTGNVGVGLETPTSKLHVNGGIRQPNYGQLWASFDGATRTVSMPAFLNDAYMNTHQDEVFTWRAPAPSFKDSVGCGAGPSANHMFANAAESTWGGTYRLIIGKAGAANIVEVQWAGWGVNLLDATFAVVGTGSNQGSVNATMTYSGGNWVVEHMQGQVGNTNFSCH